MKCVSYLDLSLCPDDSIAQLSPRGDKLGYQQLPDAVLGKFCFKRGDFEKLVK